jgi:adenine deaminase
MLVSQRWQVIEQEPRMTREPQDFAGPALRRRAVRAARGLDPFDLLITGGTVVDVATGTLRRADVGLVGPLIASVLPPSSTAQAVRTYDATGRFIAPGLIDTHLHIESSMLTPRGYAEVVVPQGTTTIQWDPHEFANVLGLDGVRWAIAASRDLPLRILPLAPSCVPSAPGLEVAGADFEPADMRTMLSWPETSGVAEVMDMRGVLDGEPRMTGIVNAGLASGKAVWGHARGLTGADLHAFAAAGIASDHEITSAEDLIEKLEAGFTLELRVSHDIILPACVAALNKLPVIPQTLTLCTDDIFPDDLINRGGMIDHLRGLVRYGLDPIAALRAATLNAAMALHRRDLGLVAPGRCADLIVLDDLTKMGVKAVFVSGKLVAENGQLTQPLRDDPVSPPASTMHVPRLSADDFVLTAPNAATSVTLNVIESARFTKWATARADARGGHVVLPDDLSMMAIVHRHGRRSSKPSLAAIGDWGRFSGCFASTVSHDSHNLCLFGRDPEDMAIAANALIASGGGMIVVKAGTILAHLKLPVCGLVSTAPPNEIAVAFRAVREAADAVAEWKPPFRVFKAFVGASLACNAGPHLTDLGLTDGGTGEIRGPLVAA